MSKDHPKEKIGTLTAAALETTAIHIQEPEALPGDDAKVTNLTEIFRKSATRFSRAIPNAQEALRLQQALEGLKKDYDRGLAFIRQYAGYKQYEAQVEENPHLGIPWEALETALRKNKCRLLRKVAKLQGGGELIGVSMHGNLFFVDREDEDGFREPTIHIKDEKGIRPLRWDDPDFNQGMQAMGENPELCVEPRELAAYLKREGYHVPEFRDGFLGTTPAWAAVEFLSKGSILNSRHKMMSIIRKDGDVVQTIDLPYGKSNHFVHVLLGKDHTDYGPNAGPSYRFCNFKPDVKGNLIGAVRMLIVPSGLPKALHPQISR